MGADAITFRCSCGLIEGSVQPAGPAHGTHVECFCRDCRAARIHLGEGDTAPGGVPIYQTTPDHVHITRGLDNLGLMRLGPEGLFRWYATCCNVTLFNTLPKPFFDVATGQPIVAPVVLTKAEREAATPTA